MSAEREQRRSITFADQESLDQHVRECMIRTLDHAQELSKQSMAKAVAEKPQMAQAIEYISLAVFTVVRFCVMTSRDHTLTR